MCFVWWCGDGVFCGVVCSSVVKCGCGVGCDVVWKSVWCGVCHVVWCDVVCHGGGVFLCGNGACCVVCVVVW